MFLISIPKPCHENWNEMSPREQGAFCKVCAKTVIDFTTASDEEVKNYFLTNSGQKTCGRFRNDQLAEPATLPELLSRPIAFWKKFLAIVLILFGNFLSGCQNTAQDKSEVFKEITLGEVESPSSIYDVVTDLKPDTTQIHCTMTTDDVTFGMIDPAPTTKGEIKTIRIEEPEEKIDSLFFVGEIVEVPTKNVGPPIPKIDSVKKITRQNDCDSLLKKPIEP